MSVIEKLGDVKLVPILGFKSYFVVGTKRVENSFFHNEGNCSVWEKKLPEELFIHILSFLNNREVIKLERVCKNFKNYWIQHLNVWKERLFENEETEPNMLFKPILETPIRSIKFYYNHFLPTIVNSFKKYYSSNNYHSNLSIVKTVLLGREKCGKSELIEIISNQDRKFNPNYYPTSSTSSFNIIPYQSEFRKELCLHFWDYPCQTDYKAFLRDARIVTFCFDLNDHQSFMEMKSRMEMYKKEYFNKLDWNKSLKELTRCVLIIGLKRDLKRRVKKSEIIEFISGLTKYSSGSDGILMRDLRIQYFELSSKIDSRIKLEFPFIYGLAIEENINVLERLDEHAKQFQTISH